MIFSLWDTEIGSRLGQFATEEEALTFVRTMIATYPRETLRDLSLSWQDDAGGGHEIVGDDLLACADAEPAKSVYALNCGDDGWRGDVVASGRRSGGYSGSGRSNAIAAKSHSLARHAGRFMDAATRKRGDR